MTTEVCTQNRRGGGGRARRAWRASRWYYYCTPVMTVDGRSWSFRSAQCCARQYDVRVCKSGSRCSAIK